MSEPAEQDWGFLRCDACSARHLVSLTACAVFGMPAECKTVGCHGALRVEEAPRDGWTGTVWAPPDHGDTLGALRRAFGERLPEPQDFSIRTPLKLTGAPFTDLDRDRYREVEQQVATVPIPLGNVVIVYGRDIERAFSNEHGVIVQLRSGPSVVLDAAAVMRVYNTLTRDRRPGTPSAPAGPAR